MAMIISSLFHNLTIEDNDLWLDDNLVFLKIIILILCK